MSVEKKGKKTQTAKFAWTELGSVYQDNLIKSFYKTLPQSSPIAKIDNGYWIPEDELVIKESEVNFTKRARLLAKTYAQWALDKVPSLKLFIEAKTSFPETIPN